MEKYRLQLVIELMKRHLDPGDSNEILRILETPERYMKMANWLQEHKRVTSLKRIQNMVKTIKEEN